MPSDNEICRMPGVTVISVHETIRIIDAAIIVAECKAGKMPLLLDPHHNFKLIASILVILLRCE